MSKQLTIAEQLEERRKRMAKIARARTEEPKEPDNPEELHEPEEPTEPSFRRSSVFTISPSQVSHVSAVSGFVQQERKTSSRKPKNVETLAAKRQRMIEKDELEHLRFLEEQENAKEQADRVKAFQKQQIAQMKSYIDKRIDKSKQTSGKHEYHLYLSSHGIDDEMDSEVFEISWDSLPDSSSKSSSSSSSTEIEPGLSKGYFIQLAKKKNNKLRQEKEEQIKREDAEIIKILQSLRKEDY